MEPENKEELKTPTEELQEEVQEQPEEQKSSKKRKYKDKDDKEEIVVLKPTVSSEEVMKSRQKNKSNELAKRIEQYNYHEGFRTTRGLGDLKFYSQEEAEVIGKKIKIKPPRKRLKFKTVLGWSLVILILGGAGYLYFSGYYKVLLPKEKEAEKTEEVVDVEINYLCKKSFDSDYKISKINDEIVLKSLNNKMKNVEIMTVEEYNLQEIPDYYKKECSKKTKYDGYLKECKIINDNSLKTDTTIDLNKLEETENIDYKLDEDIEEVTQRLEKDGYKCQKLE